MDKFDPFKGVTKATFNTMNRRRHTLIDREYHGKLTTEEKVELELLQDAVSEYVRVKAPFDWEVINKAQEQIAKARERKRRDVRRT